MVSDAGASRHGTERQGYLRARGGERGRAGGRVHLQALHRGQRGRLVALQLLHGDHAVLQRGHLAAAAGARVCRPCVPPGLCPGAGLGNFVCFQALCFQQPWRLSKANRTSERSARADNWGPQRAWRQAAGRACERAAAASTSRRCTAASAAAFSRFSRSMSDRRASAAAAAPRAASRSRRASASSASRRPTAATAAALSRCSCSMAATCGPAALLRHVPSPCAQLAPAGSTLSRLGSLASGAQLPAPSQGWLCVAQRRQALLQPGSGPACPQLRIAVCNSLTPKSRPRVSVPAAVRLRDGRRAPGVKVG